jgi:hypothetical protein
VTARVKRACHPVNPPSYLHGHSGFDARVLAIRSGEPRSKINESDLNTGSAFSARGIGARSVREANEGARSASARPLPGGRHAAALRDGHLAQAAVRLASTRAWRAAAMRDAKSAEIASPVPKYISSGVCPGNAECGSTVLYWWT